MPKSMRVMDLISRRSGLIKLSERLRYLCATAQAHPEEASVFTEKDGGSLEFLANEAANQLLECAGDIGVAMDQIFVEWPPQAKLAEE